MRATPTAALHTMASLAAQGIPQREIAKVVGCDQSTVSKRLASEDLRAMQKHETIKLMQSLPDITQTAITTIKAGKEIATRMADRVLNGDNDTNKLHDNDQANTLLQLADKKGSRIMQAMGIEASRAPSYTVMQFNQVNHLEISPVMQQALGSFMAPQGAIEEAIEAEVVEETTDREY